MGLCFLTGLFSNVVQLAFYGMLNYLGRLVVSRYTIGTAGAGLFMTLLRMIIIATMGTNDANFAPIAIYFAIALSFCFFDLFLNLRFFRSGLYKKKIV